MEGSLLTLEERLAIKPGEAITLTAVMAVLAISVMAVICYRLFKSSGGSAKIPGGWSFSWK